MTDICLVLVMAPDAEAAGELARRLVEERLAACGNIVPAVRSIYRWQGSVQDENEALLLLKTTRLLLAELSARVRELHPYEVPEVIAVPVVAGLDEYLTWVRASTRAEETQ